MTMERNDFTPTAAPKYGELRLIISAPEEVQAERDQLARIVEELDSKAGEGLGINLCLVDVPKTVGAAQEVFSGQWDVFVGIVWLQFGASVDPRDPDPRHLNAPGTEAEFSIATQATETSGDDWPKSLIYRRTQPPADLLSFNIDNYVRVQQFFAAHNAVTSPQVSIQHYTDYAEIERSFHDQLARWIAEFAARQAAALTVKGQAAENDARWDEAIVYYEQSEDLFKRLGQSESAEAVANQLARAQRGAKQDLSRQSEEQGDTSRAAHAWSDAHSAYQASLDLARDLEDREHQGQLLHKIGLVSVGQERWSDALGYYEQAEQHLGTPKQSVELQKLKADRATALESLGNVEYENKDWEKAGEHYQQALEIAGALGDRGKESALQYRLGLVAEEQGNWPRALEKYDQALEFLTGPDQLDQKLQVMRHQVVALDQVGGLARQEQNVYRAEAYYRDGVVVARSLSDFNREGELLAKLGEIAESKGQWRQALDYDRQAMAAFEQADNTEQYSSINGRQATVLERLGDAERDQQRWEPARAAYRESLSISHELGDRAGEGELLYKLGTLAEAQGQLTESLEYYRQALPAFQDLGLTERETDTLVHQLLVNTKLGDSARAVRNTNQAVTSYHQALIWAQRLADKPAEAQLFWKLGQLSAEQEQWLQAVGYYSEALADLGAAGETARPAIVSDQAIALEKLGDEISNDKNWDRAELTYQQAMELAQEGNDRRTQSALLNKLGTISERKGAWREALDRFNHSLGMAHELGFAELEPKIAENVQRAQTAVKGLKSLEALQHGDAARADKRWDEAETGYLESLSLAEELGNRAQEAELLHKLGLLSEDRAQWVDALTYYRKALPILSEQGAKDTQVKVLWNIGRAQRGAQRAAAIEALEQGDAARAEGKWEEADSAYRRSLSVATQSGNKSAEGESLYRLGLVAAGQQHWQDALEMYQQALGRLDAEKDAATQLAVKKDQAVAVSSVGDEMRAAKDWEQARSSYQFSLDFARSIGDVEGQGILLNQLGTLAADQENWQEAIGYYKDAAVHLESPESEQARVKVLRNQAAAFEQIGDLALNTKDWHRAEDSYRESISLAKEFDDRLLQGQLRDKLGLSAEDQGLWETAIDEYQQALECFKELGLVEAVNVVSENIERALTEKRREAAVQFTAKGDASLEARQWEDAAEQYRQAGELYALMAWRDEQADISSRIERAQHGRTQQQSAEQAAADGAASMRAEQWDQAADRFRAASDLYGELGLADAQATMAAQIEEVQRRKLFKSAESAALAGNASLAAKQWDEADEHFRRAADLFAGSGFADRQAEMATQIEAAKRLKTQDAAERAAADGQAALQAKQWDEAAEHFQTAVSLYAELGLVDQQAGMAARIEESRRSKLRQAADEKAAAGNASLAAKQWDEAVEHFRDALDLYAELGHSDQQDSMAALIEASQRGKVQEAAEQAAASGAAALDAKQWDPAAEHYQNALDLYAQLGLADEQADMGAQIEFARRSHLQEQVDLVAAQGDQDLAAKQWDDAEAAYQQAADIFGQLNLSDRQAEMAERLRQAQHSRNQQLTAEQAAEQAEQALAAKEWDDAEAGFQQAGDIFAQLDLPEPLLNATQRLAFTRRARQLEAADLAAHQGQAAFNQFQWDQAIELYQKANSIYADLDLAEPQADMAAHIEQTRRRKLQEAAEQAAAFGRAALEVKQWDPAAEHFRQAQDLFAQLGFADQQAEMAVHIESSHQAKVKEAADLAAAKGEESLQAGEWDEAVEQFQQARELYLQLDLDQEQGTAAERIGQARFGKRKEEGEQALAEGQEAFNSKEWDSAQVSFQRAADIFAELELTLAKADAIERLGQADRGRQLDAAEVAARKGQTAFRQFQWAQAAEHYQEARGIYALLAMPDSEQLIAEKIDQIKRAERAARLEFAEQTSAQADSFSEAKEWQQAEESYSRASDLYSELALTEPKARADAQLDFVRRQQKMEAATAAAKRGDEARDAQNWPEATNAYQTSLALVRELGNQPAQANLLEALGEVADAQEDWKSAQASYQQALDIFHDLEVPTGQMVIWRKLGGTHYFQEDWPQAFEAYQHSLTIAREFGERAFEAQVVNDLGLLEEARGDWDAALEQYRQAMGLFTELGLPDAQALVEESIEVTKRSQKKQEAMSAAARADVALAQEDWPEALEHYRKAHSLFAALGEPAEGQVLEQIQRAERGQKRYEAEQLVQRGDAAVVTHQLEQAETAYQDSAALWQELGEGQLAAQLLARVGSIAEEQGHWENAQDLYYQAGHLYGELGLADFQTQMAANLERAKMEGAKQGAARAASRGAQARDAGDWAAAESAYDESLRLTVELGDLQGEADLHNTIGSLAEDQDHWGEAAQAYRRAHAIYQRAGQKDSQTASLERVGDVHKRGKQWAEARAAYDEALTIAKQDQDRKREGELLNKLGMLDAAQGRWEEADANYKQALKLFKELELHSAQTGVWRNIAHAERGAKSAEAEEAARSGDTKRQAKQWVAAEEAYRHSMALSMEVGEHESEAWRWNDLGMLAADREDWPSAEENYHRALEIFRQTSSRDAEIQVWRNIGSARQRAKGWSAAEEAYRTSLGICQEIGDDVNEAWRWNDLGLLAAEQREWAVAQEHHQHALDIFQEAGSPEASTEVWRNLLAAQAGSYRQNLADAQEQGGRGRQGQLLNDLGLIAEKLDHWPEALDYYGQALALFEEMDLKNAQVTVWRNIGDVHRLNRHWSDAEAAYRHSLELAQQLGFRNSEANSLGLLGVVAEGKGDWPGALAMHQAAREIFESLGDKNSQVAALEKIGDAERGAQHLSQAEAAYLQALERARELNDAGREGHALEKLGLVATDRELWDVAVDYYRQALLVFEAAELPLNQGQVLSNIGYAEIGAGAWSRASEAFEGALSLYRELGDEKAAAWVGVDLARLEVAQCQFNEAIKRLENVRETCRSSGGQVEEGIILKEMARARMESGEFAEAETLANSALALFREQKDDLLQSETLRIIAALKAEREEINEAQDALERSIELNPLNYAARLDLGIALLFPGAAGDAMRQFNACLDQGSAWELRARIGLALSRHSINDVQGFRAELDNTKNLIARAVTEHTWHRVTREAAACIVEALEGDGDEAVAMLGRLKAEPPLPEQRDAYRFARLSLLLLSRTARRIKSRGALARYFKSSKTKRSRRNGTRVRHAASPRQDLVPADNVGSEEAEPRLAEATTPEVENVPETGSGQALQTPTEAESGSSPQPTADLTAAP